MSPQQAQLLRRLIACDRLYHSQKAKGDPISADWRGLEVGWVNNVNPKTAQSLVDAGLAETSSPDGQHTYLYLGSCRPYDLKEE